MGPFKGVKALQAFVIITSVPVDAQGDLAFDLFIPDVVGGRDGLGQQELGGGQEENGQDDAADDQWPDDLLQGDAACLQRCQFPGVIEDTEGDDAGKKDEYRSYLVDNKRDIEEKEFHGQGEGFAGPGEIVNLLEKIHQQVDGDEAHIDGEEISDELTKEIAVE